MDNARENLENDAVTWDFDLVKKTSQDEWNKWLGRIEVKGGSQKQRTKFYTDLWHVLLGRHKIDDVNGEYPDLTEGERYYSYTRNIHPKTRTLPRGEDGKVLLICIIPMLFGLLNGISIYCGDWDGLR